MADQTPIEWADATWNPLRGCTRVSEGCRNCYAERIAARFSDPGQPYHGFAERVYRIPGGGFEPRWTGKVELVDSLTWPLKRRQPARIFVNSTSDLFHESLHDADIDRVFAVMALSPRHTFMVLTKRAGRMRRYMRHGGGAARRISLLARSMVQWPMPNVWLGVSTEDQATADARIPHLLSTPAAVRFISAEPLLGPIDLRRVTELGLPLDALTCSAHLDWVIAGGESGPGARPMHPDWARSLRDQCQAAGVPFFFKQWGEWEPRDAWSPGSFPPPMVAVKPDGTRVGDDEVPQEVGGHRMARVGKKVAGRRLDGREWSEFPGRGARSPGAATASIGASAAPSAGGARRAKDA